MQIVPSILESSFTAFEEQVHRMEKLFPYIQIDVMDGKFVKTKSFSEVNQVATIQTELHYELHLMVKDPLAEMKKWETNTKIFRVVFPIEDGDPSEAITFARSKGWRVGLAVNPETPLEAVMPHLVSVDVVQFMTVHPGKQGSSFIPEVLEKIKEFTAIGTRPLCSVDGAVNKTTIKSLADAGVDIVCPGSALCKAENVETALAELQQALQ